MPKIVKAKLVTSRDKSFHATSLAKYQLKTHQIPLIARNA
jgi:hypothetical protein